MLIDFNQVYLWSLPEDANRNGVCVCAAWRSPQITAELDLVAVTTGAESRLLTAKAMLWIIQDSCHCT